MSSASVLRVESHHRSHCRGLPEISKATKVVPDFCNAPTMDISQLASCHSTARPIRQSPELTVVKNVIRQLLFVSGAEVTLADRLPYNIHLTYLLQLSDTSRCVFKCSPSLSTRVLRSEQYALENESRVLRLLNQTSDMPIPRRIKFGSIGHELTLRPPYLLRSYMPGTLLSQMLPELSSNDRENIERALGAHYRTLSDLSAPSFGTPQAVHAGNGSKTWRVAFLAMIEAVLRDGEDTLISLPYDSVRYYVTAHSDSLDVLPYSEPRLTALSFCSYDKVLIDEGSRQIVGLFGLDNVIWGDPDMALQNPSPAFLEGYGRDCVNDDRQQRRLLLYTVYHACERIVKAHYRSRVGEDELRAREELAEGLNKLSSWPISSPHRAA